MKVYISTHPFSETSSIPVKLLTENNIEVRRNNYGRKMSTKELASDIGDADILIAGTEKITNDVFISDPNLQFISRVGVGLDGVNFELCKKYGVRVAYTPDAPTMAVAELALGMMIDLSRHITFTDKNLKTGVWYRHMGKLIYGKTVGIIGMGRIGKSLIHLLSSFNVKIIAHDIKPDISFGKLYNVFFTTKEEVLYLSDIVSLSLPLKKDTYNYITSAELSLMKNNAILINIARGGIVNENDLYHALNNNRMKSAGIDVFSEEPYNGKLKELDNCLLTCHMGASTFESRNDMEIQAVEEVIRFFNGETLKNEVFSDV